MDKLRPVLCHSQCMSKTSTNIASAYEITAFMWLFADRDAFAAALDAGTFKEDLHVWADSISPSMLPAAGRRIADVIKASFAPAEDGEKKKKATGRKP